MSKKERQRKKNIIRNQIVEAAKIYSSQLAGKSFLYLYGEEYFEVVFSKLRFRHLTGVCTSLSSADFYKKARKGLLSVSQFYFSNDHPYDMVKKKLPCLSNLPQITNSQIIVVKELNTLSVTYKLGLTNLDFTLGLVKETDMSGGIKDWYVPATLRAKDKSIENSFDAEFVTYIFSKDSSSSKYKDIVFSDPDEAIPESAKGLIDESLLMDQNTMTG